MSWKSTSGLKVFEERSEKIELMDLRNFITSPSPENEKLQTVLPHTTVYVTVQLLQDDISTERLEKLQETSNSFDFLNDSEEKPYSKADGQPI